MSCFRIRAVLISPCLASLACIPPATVVPDPEPRAASVIVEPDIERPHDEVVTGDVVVRENAWLYARPESDIRFRLFASDEQLPAHSSRRFRVVADHGDWLELEAGAPIEWPAQECMPNHYTLLQHGLRVFVERDELVAVATRTFNVGFEDGTAVTVRPGTPIGLPRDDGWRAIETWSLRLFLPIPADVIGFGFSDLGVQLPEEGDYELLPDARLTFGGGERLDAREDVMVTMLVPATGSEEAIVRVDTPCVTAVVRTPGTQVEPIEAWGSGGFGLIGTGGGTQTWYVIAPGTTVYWADGSEAGRRRSPVTTTRVPIERGTLRCYSEEIGSGGPIAELTVELCYDAQSVEVTSDP
jgi:hypothetical protein